MKHSLPIGRVATTDEVAAAVLWLAAPESGFTVGHDLVLDGAPPPSHRLIRPH